MSGLFQFTIESSELWIGENSDRINDLSNRSYWQNPYFSSAWLQSWWKRLDGLKTPVLLVVEDEDGKLVGFWPFVERKGILKSKGLWPYVFDEANYFHPLAERDAIPHLMDGLRGLLKKYTFAWIPLMRKEFWEKFVGGRVNSGKLLNITRTPRQTFLIHHSDCSFEDFWNQKMGAKSRKSFRYDQRSLEKKGKVEIESWETFDGVRAMMPATCVVEVGSKKAKSGSGLYSIRGKRAFFFELLPELAITGKVRLSILRLDETAIAWQLDLLGNDYLAVHHLSFDEKWKKYSPGRQLLWHNLEKAWKEGRTIDLLPLKFDYKEKLATSMEDVHELHWFKRSLRGWIAWRLIRWNMLVRKKIRERSNHVPRQDNPVSKALRGETI